MSTEMNGNNQNMGDAQATEADRLRQAIRGVEELSNYYQAQTSALKVQLEAKDATIKELERGARMDKWTIGKQEGVIDAKNWKIKALKTNLSQVKEQLKKEKSRGVQLEVKIKKLEKGQGLDARASELEIENQRLKKLNRKILEELEGMKGKRKAAGGDGEGGGESEAKRMKVGGQKETGTKKRAEFPKKTVEPGKNVKTLTLEQLKVKQEPITDSEEENEVRDDAIGKEVKSERIDEVPERYTMEMLKRDIFSDYEGKEELEDEI